MYSTLDADTNGDGTTSNQTKTPNYENEGSTSPVLSNSKKSFLRLANYRSRKKLLGKFASSQDSIASSSFTDSDSVAPLSPVLLESQVSDESSNDINERYKRVRELQKQKKFHYDIAKSVNEYVDNQSEPAPSVNDNCDNNNICVGFNMVSGKKVYVSDDLVRKYTKILNDVEVDENEITIKEEIEEDNISDCSTVILGSSTVCDNNQTQITDTQILLATENAETMLEVVDNTWTPEKTSNKENSQNLNISSINFDSQWSPSSNREVPSHKEEILTPEVIEDISKSNENQEDLNIPYLEHVDTQWFLSPQMKEIKAKSETCSNNTSPQCDTVSVLSSQDFTLHITEEEDNASNTSTPKKLKIPKVDEMKTFFGKLSFSTDGSTSLRQCTETESNMQLRVKSDSWIFDVSFVNEDTLGFNSKYWKFYSKKFHSYLESYEKHIFPKKIVEIDKPIQKSNSKQRKTKNKNIKMPKKITQNRNYLKHNYNLRMSIDEDTNLENAPVFKVPLGIPIKTTPKSSNIQKDLQNSTSNVPDSEVTKVEIKASPESSSKDKNKIDYNLLNNKANVPNKEVNAVLEKMKQENPLRVNIKLKDIKDLTVIQKAIEKKKEDYLLKLKQETNNLVKDKLVELKQQAHLKYLRERDYIRNIQKQDVIVAKNTSRKKSEAKTSGENVRSSTKTNVTSKDLNISNFNSPIEGHAASLDEETFIENVDRILELIEDKTSSKQPSTSQKRSVNEEKLMDLDLSSTIQNEFMSDFSTEIDIAKTVSGSFGNESKEINRKNAPLNYSNDSGHVTLDSEYTPSNIEYAKNQFEPISGSKSNNDTEKEIIPQIVLIENTGFIFASGKKATVKSTNIFNDIFENKPKTSISEKEKQLLEEIKNIPEESVEEFNKTVILLPAEKENLLPENIKNAYQIDPKQSTSAYQNVPSTTKTNKEKQLVKPVKNLVKDSAAKNGEKTNPGFSFASGKKPILTASKSKNIFSDIFENDSTISKSNKEEKFLKQVKNISTDSTVQKLQQNEEKNSPGFSFASGKKPTLRASKSKNIFSDIFENESPISKSNKEEKFLKQVKNISEDSTAQKLPQNKEKNSSTCNSAFVKKATITTTKNNGNESKTTTDTAVKLLPQIKENGSPGFSFASGRKPLMTSTKSINIFSDIFNNDSTAKTKKEAKLLENLQNITAEKLSPIKENDIPGFTFASGKKPIIMTTVPKNIFSDIIDDNTAKEEKQLGKLSQSEEKNCPGFSFASGKKPSVTSTKSKNIFSDIFENDSVAAKSKKEEKLLENLTVEKLQTKEKDCPGFSFASGKKPIIANTKSKNIFSDIFNNENIGAKSKKEEQLLKKIQNMTECSAQEILPLNELNPNTGLSFITEKKPVTKSTSIGSKNKEQFLTGLKDITEDNAEELLPQDEIKEDSPLVSGIKSTIEPTNMSNDLLSKEASDKAADNSGFSFVSGRKPIIKPTNIFNDMFGNEASTSKSKKEQQFLEGLQNVPPVECDSGFSFVSGKKAAPKSSNIFKDIFDTEIKEAKSSKEKELLDAITNEENDKPEENNNKNTTIPPFSSPVVGLKRPFNSPQIAANTSTPITKRPKLGTSSKKRSLGSVAKTCRQLNLSEHSAKKAKLIFEDIDVVPDLMNKSIVVNTTNSPRHFTSTPIAEENTTNTSLLNTSISMKETNETLVNSQKMKTSPMKTQPHQSFLEKHIPSFYAFHKSEIDDNKQKSLLEKKYELLNLEMSVIKTRIQMLEEQEILIKNSNENYRKQRTGCLLCQKSKHQKRIALKELGRLQLNAFNASKVDKCILEISPQNAINFRFFVPWWTNDNRTYPAIIPTEDGAILIPNDQNYIGIHEIEQGFLAMPGIDPKLIPENWIRNHYKWIVWKFGSYERNLPNKFKGILMVENIVAQLKYRYDREIDLAQRPAIRRILEMDDSPAKRMVLCVSNIYKSQSLQNELELTDGWYSIKTVIDSALNNLITTNKIFIGLKLMIHGAELLNCEGCHPLQTPANVRLQIHFNSTRRAAWHAKLGYQRNPGPLNVNLHNVRNLGGQVGFTTVYIARVYPVCFMEHGEKIIWRDRKAERKRANEWENSQKDSIEEYLEQTKKELNAERKERLKNRKKQNRVLLSKHVSNINDPSLLYELWEECNDPESLTELLTEEQCKMLKNYQVQRNAEEQAELAYRLRKKLDEKNVKNRNVSSVLKLLIVDVNSLYHYRILSIWRPTETHLQELKEGECVDFYNLIIKDARNLSSTTRTRFTLNCNLNKTKFERFERKAIPINETINKQMFEEFDTVGFVVEISNEEDNKFMWIVDENKTFLLIRIRSTLQVVSILDGISLGKVVALQNLLYQKPTENYAIAMANCYTNLYVRPHQPYLQVFMLQFIKKLPENKEEFFEDCQLLVNAYKTEDNIKLSQLSTSMMYDNTINKNKNPINNTVGFESDVLTVSDEEMSLIDTQYF